MATLIPALNTCVHRMTAGEMVALCRRVFTIKITTMHASIGLEWLVVAALTSEPKEKMSQEDLEMESELAYVAATKTLIF